MADNSDGRLKQAKLGINIIAYLIEKSDFDEKHNNNNNNNNKK